MSKLGDLGLYGKLIQRATQPNWILDPKHNGSKQYSTPRDNLISGEKQKTFLASQSWSTSTPTLFPLQMCQHHHVNNTMCMCVSISQSFSKDFHLISPRHSILATSQCYIAQVALDPVMHFSTQPLTGEMKCPTSHTFALRILFHLPKCWCHTSTNLHQTFWSSS